MKRIIEAVSLAAMLALAGCAAQRDLAENAAYLAPGTVVTLPEPQFAASFEALQLLEISFKDGEHERSESVMVNVSLKPRSIALTALSPLGMRLFSAEYRQGGDIAVHGEVPLDGLPDPRQVLLDMLLCFSDTAALQKIMPPSVKITDEGTKRVIADGGTRIYEIEYLEDQAIKIPVLITHKIFGYSIRISTLS